MKSKQGRQQWDKTLDTTPPKLTPQQKKMLSRFGEAKGVDDHYNSSSLCVKTKGGVWRQTGGYF